MRFSLPSSWGLENKPHLHLASSRAAFHTVRWRPGGQLDARRYCHRFAWNSRIPLVDLHLAPGRSSTLVGCGPVEIRDCRRMRNGWSPVVIYFHRQLSSQRNKNRLFVHGSNNISRVTGAWWILWASRSYRRPFQPTLVIGWDSPLQNQRNRGIHLDVFRLVIHGISSIA